MANSNGKMSAVPRAFVVFMIASAIFFMIVLFWVVYYGDGVPWKPKPAPAQTTLKAEPTPSLTKP